MDGKPTRKSAASRSTTTKGELSLNFVIWNRLDSGRIAKQQVSDRSNDPAQACSLSQVAIALQRSTNHKASDTRSVIKVIALPAMTEAGR